jgi:hypothetical protein
MRAVWPHQNNPQNPQVHESVTISEEDRNRDISSTKRLGEMGSIATIAVSFYFSDKLSWK